MNSDMESVFNAIADPYASQRGSFRSGTSSRLQAHSILSHPQVSTMVSCSQTKFEAILYTKCMAVYKAPRLTKCMFKRPLKSMSKSSQAACLRGQIARGE